MYGPCACGVEGVSNDSSEMITDRTKAVLKGGDAAIHDSAASETS